jgi:uncharacterized lipoprotein YajG
MRNIMIVIKQLLTRLALTSVLLTGCAAQQTQATQTPAALPIRK